MNPFLLTRPNPYAVLRGLMGGTPQVLAHADDLAFGAIGSWVGRNGVNLIGNGSPTVNATGWSGSFKTASLVSASSQYFSFDAEASNYTVATPFVWVLATKITASAAARNCLFLGHSGSNNNYRGFTVQATNDYAYLSSNRNGTGEFDTQSVAVAESVQSIIVVSLSAAGDARIVQTTSSGETTLLNTTHTMSGTMTLNKFTLGALYINTGPIGYTGQEVRFLACLRSPSITIDGPQITKITNHVRRNLRCPL